MKTRYLERWLFSAFLAVLLMASSGMSTNVFGQTSNTGTVTGVVKDEKGGLVPGASVKIVNLGTNAERTATTTSEGVYEITQLSRATIAWKFKPLVFPSTFRSRWS